MRSFVLLSGLFLFLGLFSCSRAEPRILYGYIEKVYYPGTVRPEERYSFFILTEDDDGMENLSELYLYHDREGLRWLMDSGDWVLYEEDGKTWIGSRNIVNYAGAPLPRGQYRAVLVNKAGEKTERNFTFDAPADSPHPYPLFSVINDTYRIDSRYPVNNLICYDEQGNAVQTITMTEIEGNIGELRLSNSIRSAALWAEDPEYRISALTEVVAVR